MITKKSFTYAFEWLTAYIFSEYVIFKEKKKFCLCITFLFHHGNIAP